MATTDRVAQRRQAVKGKGEKSWKSFVFSGLRAVEGLWERAVSPFVRLGEEREKTPS